MTKETTVSGPAVIDPAGLPVPGCVLDARDGRVMSANPAALALACRNDATALEEGLWAESPWSLAEARQWIDAAVTEGPQCREWRVLRPDGSVVPVEIHSVRLDREGDPRLLCILFDISERLATEEHLRHLQRMEAIGQLAGGVAHDFNNLLTPILGFGEFLEAEALAGRTSPDQVRQATGEIVVAARRAQQLVSQLLLFSRRQKAEKKPLSLTSLVSGFERMLRRMIREDIEFSISIPAVRLMVHADAGQLEQLLMNLALNSQHALPGGGHFSISLTELDGQACLDVGDDGVGIEAEALPRVFEPFFTTDPEKRHGGLALASAYGIVQQHEGTISVESSPGQGTHFRILLPLVCAVPKVVPEARMAPPSGHETLLVVEDDDQVRTLVVRILENAGYTVLAANRPKHAIGLLEHFPDPVSLVLTDVVMPEMNGSEMFEKIRARRPGIRVLYMSGYPNEALGEKAAGSLDIVKKPFAIHELLARVRAALDGSLI